MDQQKIGSFLKELRKGKGLTQEQLAEYLNVSGRTVSRWETGNNMPDISILIEIAEFYDVSIPEIIDGERKSENMNEETKKVAESLSDYAEAEKVNIIKEMRKLSISGVCALLIYEILDVTGYAAANDILSMVAGYCLTLVFVCTILMPILTTGMLHKIRLRKLRLTRKIQSSLPKPIIAVISAIVAFAAAVIIKFVLSRAVPFL